MFEAQVIRSKMWFGSISDRIYSLICLSKTIKSTERNILKINGTKEKYVKNRTLDIFAKFTH